jgi:hypothetical protein
MKQNLIFFALIHIKVLEARLIIENENEFNRLSFQNALPFSNYSNINNSSELIHEIMHAYTETDDENHLPQVVEKIIKNRILLNRYSENRAGFLTHYCGVGDTVGGDGPPVEGIFNEIDKCCKDHDHCNDYLSSIEDFSKYPGNFSFYIAKRFY